MQDFFEKNKVPVLLFLLGIILFGIGVLGKKIINFSSGTKVEILGEMDKGERWEVGNENKDTTIKVEIAGEVLKPGVYDLKEGSRVNDLLVVGGGLSANADRDYVAKNINLAMKLNDGVKVFIPKKGEEIEVGSGSSMGSGVISSKININTAGEAELDTLYGIGPATALKIIEGRPYQTTDELLKKKIVKTNVWEGIKEKVTVY